jgi:hypothetical protein
MPKTTIYSSIALACMLFCGSNPGFSQQRFATGTTFTEMADPTKDTLSNWSNVKTGLHASFVSIDKRYPKSVNPNLTTQRTAAVDAWNVQTSDPYADMFTWTKAKDGSWTYDYTVFDRWVNFMMDLGVNKQINCYSLLPWNNEVHYFDESKNELVNVIAKPGTAIFEELWTPFLKDFSKHITAKGWLKITNIAMDERGREEMDPAIALLEKVAPEFGVAFADNHKSYQRYHKSTDISVAAGDPFDQKDLIERRKKGYITTFYVCCSDEFPNQFTFSDPAESTYMAWYALAAGFDGALRWAFNSWVKDPLHDSRFRTWPAGDTYIVYPQGRSSIRYERMLEGIQDYTKVGILKAKLEKSKDQANLAKLNAKIAKLNTAKRYADWNKDLNDAKRFVDELSRQIN